MRVLVLGGTGFIGPTVVERLVAQGHQVAVFHRGQQETLPTTVDWQPTAAAGGSATSSPAPAVEHLHGDRARLGDHAAEFRRLAPDVVLDMLALTERDAQAVVSTFRGVARRLVVVSSADVYRAYGRLHGSEPGPLEPLPLTEDAPLRERLYPYRGPTPRPPDDPQRWIDDYDKILVERAAAAAPELPATILRLPMVYGPRDGQHRLAPYLQRMDDGRPAILLDERLTRFRAPRGYVDDVAAAIALAATVEQAAGRVYNVGEARALTEVEWVQAIAAAVGWSGRVVTLPAEHLPAHLHPPGNPAQSLVLDTGRLRRELGYAEATTPAAALARTIAWERANPPPGAGNRASEYAAEDAALATTPADGA